MFLRDLEEDPEFRSNINLYKATDKPKMEEEEELEIPIEELLEDMTLDDDVEME